MVKVFYKSENNVPIELLNEYKHKRDRAEVFCSNRREEYYKEHKDLKETMDNISSLYYEKGISLIRNNDVKIEKEYDNKIKELIKKRDALLEKYNISDFYPIYECNVCSDQGIIDGKKCSCLLKKEKEFFKHNSNYDSDYGIYFRNDTFDSIDFNKYDQKNVPVPSEKTYKEYMQSNIQKIQKCIENIRENPINILLMGPVGTGKTFLANCIANKALDQNLSIVNISSIDLTNSFFDKDRDETLQILYKVDLLIIDDLGSEYSSDYSNPNLFSIMDKRIIYNKPTIISTNLSYDEIKDYYKERVASRLTNNYNLFKLYGRDLRENY